MNAIALRHEIEKGGFHLQVETSIPATGITGVFGESGAGKTTLLRCIAGLDPSPGDSAGPIHKRRIGFVFQQPQLFAHLNVRRNIEYGYRRNTAAKADLDEIIRLLELSALLHRRIAELSGGEAQRVSIARVLAQSPRLILMDEPMSGLDERRRGELLPYLDRLHAESAIPILYVSHSIDEICRLSDHLLVMHAGRIVAEGTLQQTLSRIDLPQLGGSNAGSVIEARSVRHDSEFDLSLFRFSGGELWVPGGCDTAAARLRISADNVSLSRDAATSSTILNILPARIESISTESASSALVRLQAGDDRLVARITRRSLQQLQLQIGDEVYAQIKSVTVRR